MDLYSYLVDKKLEMCTSSDLEAVITNCLRRHISWGDPSLSRVREIPVGPWRDGPLAVLPGGRWAIVFSESGEAFVLDLHHPSGDTFQHTFLFPSATSTPPRELTPVVQTQEAGFQTALKMAVFSSAGSDEHRIQVWLLQPLYDAVSGHVDGLKAELLSSFAGHPHPHSELLHHSISGSFLGCVVAIPDCDEYYDEEYGVLIDWTKAHGIEDWEAIPKYVLPFGESRTITCGVSVNPTPRCRANSDPFLF